jgi:hypothetical protein
MTIGFRWVWIQRDPSTKVQHWNSEILKAAVGIRQAYPNLRIKTRATFPPA